MLYRETGRKFEIREKEHKKELKQLERVKYIRARRKESLMEIHQLALTDHVASKNHTLDWEGVKLPAKEPDWKKREVKEAIFIRKVGILAINQDGGCHHLPKFFLMLSWKV